MRASEHPFQGMGATHVDMPTFDIPVDCMCTWSVIRPGVGRACISRLKYANALCQHRHVPAGAPA